MLVSIYILKCALHCDRSVCRMGPPSSGVGKLHIYTSSAYVRRFCRELRVYIIIFNLDLCSRFAENRMKCVCMGTSGGFVYMFYLGDMFKSVYASDGKSIAGPGGGLIKCVYMRRRYLAQSPLQSCSRRKWDPRLAKLHVARKHFSIERIYEWDENYV